MQVLRFEWFECWKLCWIVLDLVLQGWTVVCPIEFPQRCLGAPDCLDSMPVYCFEECVAKAAARLSGSAGPCGVDAEMLKNWLLRHGDYSGRLRDAMATWVDWLSNGSPPYAAYHAVNTVRTVALDKSPGVRPLGIGESWMRL